MNEDWYMVGIVVDMLCELMLSLYFLDVNISWSTWTIPGSWLSWHLAHLVRLTNRLVSTFGLDLGRMSPSSAPFGVSEEPPVVNKSYTSINDDGKNLNNQKSNYYHTTCADGSGKMTRKVHFLKFESMRFQSQSRQSQEIRTDCETRGVLSEEQVNARSHDTRRVPSIVNHPLRS